MNNNHLTLSVALELLEKQQLEALLNLHGSQTKLVLFQMLSSKSKNIDLIYDMATKLDFERIRSSVEFDEHFKKSVVDFVNETKRVEKKLREEYN